MHPSRSPGLRFVVLCAATISFADATSAADDFTAAPSTIADGDQGVLLLHDGGALTGRISRVASSYVVTHGGSEIQIAPSRVFFIGSSLREAYEYRRTRLSSDTADAHLALADWCFRYSLLPEAGAELEIARSLQADHPRVLLLDRRLAAAYKRPSGPNAAHPATAAPAAAAAASSSSQPAPPVMPDLPPGVLENFTRKVQPVLVNNCTAAKCHEPGGPQQFQLNRAILRGEANRRTTTENLAATLALVNREQPEKSRLLTLPRQTHARMDGPIFGPRQGQAFQNLADWVALLAPPKTVDEEQPDATAETAPTAAPTATTERARQRATAVAAPAELLAPPAKPIAKIAQLDAAGDAAVQHTGSARSDPALRPASAAEVSAPLSLRWPHRLKFGATAVPWQPRDPFDPEIFNRRQRAPTAGPAPPNP